MTEILDATRVRFIQFPIFPEDTVVDGGEAQGRRQVNECERAASSLGLGSRCGQIDANKLINSSDTGASSR